jgi:hypothetical protein
MKRFVLCLSLIFLLVGAADAQNSMQNNPPNSASWSGILVSSACKAEEAFAEAPDCTKKVPGAKLALMDETTGVVYSLELQESVSAHLGEAVTVHGTLNGESIKVSSVEPMTRGLSVGQHAPPFSIRDQFGKMQTLDSLKGTNGTVLLFFRSADW